jgi:3-phenylpropionate/trans-cinnamate dioxygenase ferredoxin subunit
MARFVVGDLPICLIHADDGRFYAIEDRCSHEDYALSEGELDGHTVECPRHGSRFDIRSGDVLNPPAVSPVVTFAIELNDDAVRFFPQPETRYSVSRRSSSLVRSSRGCSSW